MQKFAKTFRPEQGISRVQKITVKLTTRDCTGVVKVTDIMLQGGSIATTWVGHPSEIRWSFDNG
ncbi:hypothetical protein [Mahella australiensis]|uniref:Uncharacterized protein n=1 Tax=Mahella australiensis (strain DSM 15567 / CIP 107919 / 50-1 BON) TaxID=697281 RepID=F3ZVD0_MAHA5|nr:hypothetical protein [Mahella australiensis]AEE95280.1 hypothetical protein Mahau_0057 [Mahella australiensis 50-1 BON]